MVDYNFYALSYRGMLPEEDFYRLEPRAQAYIDSITRGKSGNVQQSSPLIQPLQKAVCSVVDELFEQENGSEITSESNDGYAVSYKTSDQTIDQRLYANARLYLGNTNLLCRWL